MVHKLFFNAIFCLFLISCFFSCNQKQNGHVQVSEKSSIISNKRLFKKISSENSGIHFSNILTENLETNENLFNFDYFYNGAGVGVEDINNDGLLDIFFCGNQVPNKLYLNKGGFRFEDISESAKINDGKIWSNGVTFVDINHDGWMDIYVSQGGPNRRLRRKNLLYINQKNNTFLEKAEDFGLADMGISTQSVFLDYDRDGDLDCFVMNENELYGVDPVNLYKFIESDSETKYFNSSHLYKNDDGKYVDATKESGIERPIFGLGIAVNDFNNDFWPDIYLASDYYIPDALFINQRNGSFSDKIKEYTNQISFYGMGVDIADINNDCEQDIFVLDMASSDHKRSKTLMASMSTARFDYLVNKAKFQHQYMYNSLHLNLGNTKYNNIAQLTETANTDWSWSVLMSDFDLDGDKDIYITNGYRRYAMDNDVQNNVFKARMKYGNKVPLELKKSLYYQMPSEKLPNILYENEGNLEFKNNSDHWGLADYTFSNGTAQGDFDNDGDLDLVVNNIDDQAILYKNQAVENNQHNFLKIKLNGVTSETTARVKIQFDGEHQLLESKRVRGYRSSHDKSLIFGLGKSEVVDTLRITWDNGTTETRYNIRKNSTITLNITDAKKDDSENEKSKALFKKAKLFQNEIVSKENSYDDFESEILLPYKQSTLGPFMSQGDIDKDGLTDIFLGGATGQPGRLFKNTGNGFKLFNSTVLNDDRGYEDMESVFFDFDNDGDQDLYVVSGSNEFEEHSSYFVDRLYINDGLGNFSKSKQTALEKLPKNGKTVAVFDFDGDNDLDVLVGNRVIPKNYPKHQSSTLYENRDGILIDVTKKIVPELEHFGIINAFEVTDFNKDGLPDFIAVGEWTGVGFFENQGGRFQYVSKEKGLDKEKGWWFSIKETDLNNDGLKDYVLGNVGLNFKFKATAKKPFKVYANDFDDNGSNDIVLSKKYNGEYVPVRGRECSSQQMPFIKEKFATYNEFADASLVDIYGDELSDSYQKNATEFNSIALINEGAGNFKKIILPKEAQMFPVLSIEVLDFNEDGFEDCLLAGNLYETEVETPRLDAFSGLVLLSDKKNAYTPLPYQKVGLYLEGNIKDMLRVKTKIGNHILFSRNGESLISYSYN